MGNGTDSAILERNNQMNWIGQFNKYGLPGLVIMLMAFFIWSMFTFITGGQAQKIDRIYENTSEMVKEQKATNEILRRMYRKERGD